MAAPRLVVEFDASLIKKGAVEVKKAFADMGVSAEAFERAVEKSVSKNKKLEGSLRSIESRLDPVARATERYERTVSKLDEGLRRGIIDQDKYNRLLGMARQEFSASGNAAANASTQILKYAASFLSIQAGINVIRQLMNAQMDLERVQARLRVASGGSSALAAETYKELSVEAKRLGLDLNALANSYSKIAVATRGTTLEGKQTKEIFLGIAEASAALGLSAEQSEGALRAVEQMISKGNVSAEELRGQLGERLPGAFGMAAKAMGVTTSELNEMLKKGEVLAADLLPKLAQELRNTYGAEALTNADRLTGATNNLSTAWTELKNAINEAGLGEEMVETVKLATQALGGLVDVIQTLDRWLTSLGQGSLAEFLSKLTVLGQLKSVVQSVKDIIPGGDAAPGATGGPRRITVQPIERYKPAAFDAEVAMQAALMESVKALDAAKEAGEKYTANLKEIERLEASIAEHRAAADLSKWTLAMQELQGITAEFKADINVLETMTVEAGSLETAVRGVVDAVFGTSDALDQLSTDRAMADLRAEVDALNAEFAEFEKQVSENFLRGVQSSLSSFFYEAMSGGEDALENFGKALKDLLFKTLAEYLAQWAITQAKMLALSLKRIAAEKAAQQAANAAGGGGGGGGMSMGSMAGMFGGGGSGGSSAMSAAGPYLWAAAAVVAVLALKNWGDKRRDAKQYTDLNSFDYEDGRMRSARGTRGIRANDQIYGAVTTFWQTIESATGAMLTGMDRLVIRVRHDQERFRVELGGVVVGTFKSANEAIIAGIKAQFASAEFSGGIAQAVREAVENFKGNDPEKLIEAVNYVQSIVDAVSGLSEVEQAIQRIPAQINQMRESLLQLGVSMSEATRLSGLAGVKSYRDAWRSISGQRETPGEEKERKERERQFLLAQLKLDRARLAADMARLKAQAGVVRVGLGLAQTEIKGRHRILEAQGGLVRAEFGLMSSYVQGRSHFVEAEAELFNAELEAMGLVLAELDKLIKEVESTPIRLAGSGRGKGSLDNVIGGAGRFGGGGRLITALERLISAVDKLREFQKSLAQDEQLTPYSVEQRFGMAQSQFQSVSSAAQQGKVWAIEMLPDVARQYLELASQMYGTAGAGYGGIFAQVNQILQAISDQYPAGTDPQAWMRSGMDSVNRYLAAIRGDAGRREQQHDETNVRIRESNRTLDRIADGIETMRTKLGQTSSVGTARPGIGGPRQGGGNFRAA